MEITYELDGKQSSLLFSEYEFEVLDGPDTGLRAHGGTTQFRIGTAVGCDLLLTDSTVSKHHCSIALGEDGVLLRDHESTNGTRIAGTRVREAYLNSGTVLRLGETEIRFTAKRESVKQSLSKRPCFGTVFGNSVGMRRIFDLLPRLAVADATILLTGETGTGKSLIAKAIHAEGPRSAQPMITVDCGAIPPNLVESELFGHERGAFTGADMAREGAFEAAKGGTLFLDEIVEMPIDLQPKLLSALEEKAIRRVGATTSRKVGFRLIAATNRDLAAAVNRNDFRADLYYRINTIPLEIPPLRKRRGDIPLLVEHFHHQLTDGPPPKALVDELSRGDWPGNVREVRNAVERAVVVGDPEIWRAMGGGTSPATAAPEEDEVDLSLSFKAAKEQAIASWEMIYLKRLLSANDGNLAQAARTAQMDRKHLRLLLRRHDIDR